MIKAEDILKIPHEEFFERPLVKNIMQSMGDEERNSFVKMMGEARKEFEALSSEEQNEAISKILNKYNIKLDAASGETNNNDDANIEAEIFAMCNAIKPIILAAKPSTVILALSYLLGKSIFLGTNIDKTLLVMRNSFDAIERSIMQYIERIGTEEDDSEDD